MSVGIDRNIVRANGMLVSQAVFMDIESNWHLRSRRRVKQDSIVVDDDSKRRPWLSYYRGQPRHSADLAARLRGHADHRGSTATVGPASAKVQPICAPPKPRLWCHIWPSSVFTGKPTALKFTTIGYDTVQQRRPIRSVRPRQ